MAVINLIKNMEQFQTIFTL